VDLEAVQVQDHSANNSRIIQIHPAHGYSKFKKLNWKPSGLCRNSFDESTKVRSSKVRIQYKKMVTMNHDVAFYLINNVLRLTYLC